MLDSSSGFGAQLLLRYLLDRKDLESSAPSTEDLGVKFDDLKNK